MYIWPGYFLAAELIYTSKSNLREKGLSWLSVIEEHSPSWWGHGGRHGGRNRSLAWSHCVCCQETGSEQEVGPGYKASRSTPSDSLAQGMVLPMVDSVFLYYLTIKNKTYFTVPPIFHKFSSSNTIGVHISHSIPAVWLDLLEQNWKNAARVGILSQEGCVNLGPLSMVVVGRLLWVLLKSNWIIAFYSW